MQAKDTIRYVLNGSDRIINAYLSDLDDADLLVRPVPGMNHIAWQVGHLIATERFFLESARPGSSPPLPEGFDEGHGRERFNVDDPSKYLGRERYQALWKAQRDATLKVLDSLSDSDLDAPGPGMRGMAETVGDTLTLIGTHALMHSGQFVAVRRHLGKPVTI